MDSDGISVRINGVLSDVNTGPANTSISVYYKGFHLLVDAGNGVAESIRKGARNTAQSPMPDAILITHARSEHVNDLAALIRENTKVYTTGECKEQLTKVLPSLNASAFIQISPGNRFDVGPCSVIPIAADNAGDQPGFPGSVVFVITAGTSRVVAAWDFLKLPGVDENVMRNPDLLVLGTETYNDHPSTGMISVSEAYNLVRRFNARMCYVLHYSGEKDREDAKNQWHRGPAGPLSQDDLQKAIDDHLKVSGREGKFAIQVGKEGMVWTPPREFEDEGPIGPKIEIDALDKHSFSIERTNDGKVMISIEDNINRMMWDFINPKLNENSLHADAIKGTMIKGPELQLDVSGNTVKLDIAKGKKSLFGGDMPVSEKDSRRILRYLYENFQQPR